MPRWLLIWMTGSNPGRARRNGAGTALTGSKAAAKLASWTWTVAVVGRPCRAAGGLSFVDLDHQCEQAGAGRVGDTYSTWYERFH